MRQVVYNSIKAPCHSEQMADNMNIYGSRKCGQQMSPIKRIASKSIKEIVRIANKQLILVINTGFTP